MNKSQDRPVRTDWEAIERAYRAGVLSIREIAAGSPVSDTAIRKRAGVHGWTRDLTAKVQQRVRTVLVREPKVRTPREPNPETDQEIIEEAAGEVVAVVRHHRSRIHRQTDLVDLLTQQLVDVAGQRGDFEAAIDEETASDKTGDRRARLMKAIALPTHASTAVNLSNALKTLIGLERQAFSIKDDSETPISALADLLRQVSGTGLPIVRDAEDSAE